MDGNRGGAGGSGRLRQRRHRRREASGRRPHARRPAPGDPGADHARFAQRRAVLAGIAGPGGPGQASRGAGGGGHVGRVALAGSHRGSRRRARARGAAFALRAVGRVRELPAARAPRRRRRVPRPHADVAARPARAPAAVRGRRRRRQCRHIAARRAHARPGAGGPDPLRAGDGRHGRGTRARDRDRQVPARFRRGGVRRTGEAAVPQAAGGVRRRRPQGAGRSDDAGNVQRNLAASSRSAARTCRPK